MADNTSIEWTDATWNPITGCSVVSPGCTNCYAMKLAGTRLKHHPTRVGLTRESKSGPVWNGEVRFNERQLLEPLGWKRPRTIFVCAHGDLFHESVPDAWIDRVFAVMAATPRHTFQVLTKRPERMRRYLADQATVRRVYDETCDLVVLWQLPVVLLAAGIADPEFHPDFPRIPLGRWPLPNVWLGTSVEDQRRADERIPHLLQTPAAIHFLSAEPLLGPINLREVPVPDEHAGKYAGHGYTFDALREKVDLALFNAPNFIDWVIVGGESGPAARPMHPDWARTLRDQCQAAGVPFFFKQWGSFKPSENYPRVLEASDAVAWPDGTVGRGAAENNGGPGLALWHVSKKAAGRLLDGVQHDAMPERG